MIKYVTQQTWKQYYEPENDEPSMTRTDDYVSIEELFARFKATEGLFEVFKPIAQLSPEEKEVLYDSVDVDDLADEDLTIQKEFIDEQHRKLTDYLPEEEDKVAESEPTQPKAEPEQPIKSAE